jgi:DtxR family Mn-dependent transcriptional regulator
MIGRLRGAGLVEAPQGRAIHLTEQGAIEGARLVRRHRLSERFLVDYLDMPWDAVHEEACKLEHVLSPEVEERLAAQLGHPRTCPHGHVIPAADGSLVEEELRSLVDLKPGESGVIACITQEDSDLLKYLGSLGLVPDTPVELESVAPFGGPLLIRVAGSQYALGREVAGKIMLRA